MQPLLKQLSFLFNFPVTDLLSAVIGLGVALGVALLFASTIFTTMLLFQCVRKYITYMTL